MLLTMDIGNTNISIGIFDGDKLTVSARIATERQKTDDQYAVDFVNIFSVYNISVDQIEGSVISSVVPEITAHIKNAVCRLTGKKVIVLSPEVETGLNVLIDNPAQLGADLAAGAVGACQYPLPAFVVDLGTATKIFVVDENRGFRGCMIAPGVAISLKALTDTSSLLPAIPLEPPKKACGTNTVESMQSGIVLGTAAMIDGLIDRFVQELGEPKTIIATGGLSAFITPVCKRETVYDKDLVLKGLKAIYYKNS